MVYNIALFMCVFLKFPFSLHTYRLKVLNMDHITYDTINYQLLQKDKKQT